MADGTSSSSERALGFLAWSYFFSFAGVGIQVPLLSPALETLGLLPGIIGGLWATRSLTSIAAPFFFGLLADRTGSDRLLAAAAHVVLALSIMALALTGGREGPSFALFALYGLVGTTSISLIDGLVLTALGDEHERYGRVRTLGVVGFGVAAMTATALHQAGAVGPNLTFLGAGAMALVAAGLITVAPVPGRPKLRQITKFGIVLSDPVIRVLAAFGVLHWAGHGAYTAFVVKLGEERGLPSAGVGGVLLFAIVVETFVMRSSGPIIARVGGAKICAGVAVLGVGRWALLALTDDIVSFTLLHALHGITFGLFYPVLVTLVARRVPDQMRQSAQGTLTSVVFGIGGALGLGASGWVLERAGGAWTWAAMMGFAVAASLFAVLLWTMREQVASEPAARDS